MRSVIHLVHIAILYLRLFFYTSSITKFINVIYTCTFVL